VLLAGRHKVQAKQFQLRRLLFFNFATKSRENRGKGNYQPLAETAFGDYLHWL
jgi:hypothetical protein